MVKRTAPARAMLLFQNLQGILNRLQLPRCCVLELSATGSWPSAEEHFGLTGFVLLAPSNAKSDKLVQVILVMVKLCSEVY